MTSRPAVRCGARLLASLAVGLALCGTAHATRYCDAGAQLSAEQKDKLFRFGAVIKDELDKSGARLALIARSGLDLKRFQVRYSHAGVSLKASPDTPWAVRQLYFACEEGKPLIFDQGMSAFLMGGDEPAIGYVSILLLPDEAAAQLEHAALDNRRALQLLGGTYSANAYPFSALYQNCNQWVMELLATAWGGTTLGDDARGQAQAWLKTQAYEPAVFDVGWPLMMLSAFVPWVHRNDHPAADLQQQLFRVSMPSSIEAFVQARVPGATRIEFCHNGRQVVVHRGWSPVGEGCTAGADDTVFALD